MKFLKLDNFYYVNVTGSLGACLMFFEKNQALQIHGILNTTADK